MVWSSNVYSSAVIIANFFRLGNQLVLRVHESLISLAIYSEEETQSVDFWFRLKFK